MTAKVKVELVEPLDYMILDLMPVEGTMALGVYPQGILVSDIRKKIAGGKLTSEQISTRVRLMSTVGMVVRVKGIGTSGKNIWQRTPEGERVLNEWRKRNGSN